MHVFALLYACVCMSVHELHLRVVLCVFFYSSAGVLILKHGMIRTALETSHLKRDVLFLAHNVI